MFKMSKRRPNDTPKEFHCMGEIETEETLNDDFENKGSSLSPRFLWCAISFHLMCPSQTKRTVSFVSILHKLRSASKRVKKVRVVCVCKIKGKSIIFRFIPFLYESGWLCHNSIIITLLLLICWSANRIVCATFIKCNLKRLLFNHLSLSLSYIFYLILLVFRCIWPTRLFLLHWRF